MKPRRDITLGEMQDECNRRKLNKYEVKCGGCPYDGICAPMPCDYNLTDPPRFNEAQMALLVTMKNIGARHATQRSDAIRFYNIAPLECIAVISKQILNVGETLDLAELFGKEGA